MEKHIIELINRKYGRKLFRMACKRDKQEEKWRTLVKEVNDKAEYWRKLAESINEKDKEMKELRKKLNIH